jgi:hypothetical protein
MTRNPQDTPVSIPEKRPDLGLEVGDKGGVDVCVRVLGPLRDPERPRHDGAVAGERRLLEGRREDHERPVGVKGRGPQAEGWDDGDDDDEGEEHVMILMPCFDDDVRFQTMTRLRLDLVDLLLMQPLELLSLYL